MKPKIGITPAYNYEKNRLNLTSDYYEGIIQNGGIPIILPLTHELSILDEYINICDGFLFTGGPDIDAKYYNEVNHKNNGDISPIRDELEILLMRKIIDVKKPILNICRGMQLLNVVLGGTLYQDLFSQLSDNIIKHVQEAPNWYPTHKIEIQKNTKVFDIFEKEEIEVNSRHHQAIKDLGKGLIASAKSSDGIIEAIELEGGQFVIGVQWHPESMIYKYKEFNKLFKALIDICKE